MPNTRKSPLSRALLILPLLTAFAAVPAAFGADKPAKKDATPAAGKGAGYLTRDQLRDCMSRKDKMKVDDAELLKDEEAMTARKADIVRGGDELKAKLDSIDRTSADAVAAYNAAVQSREKQIDEFQTSATAFNARVETKVAAHADYDQSCGNRRYFEEDEAAIKKGK